MGGVDHDAEVIVDEDDDFAIGDQQEKGGVGPGAPNSSSRTESTLTK